MHITEVGEVEGMYTKFRRTWKLVSLEFGWRDEKKPRSSVLRILFPYMHNRFAQNIIFKKQTQKSEKHEPIKISIKAPCLHPVFGPPFTPKPLFQPQISGIHKVMKLH